MSSSNINLNKEFIVIATAGSVDDGKSTLIGRLLYDCNDIYEDQMSVIRRDEYGNINSEDLALITDGLSAEREQGITIDVAYRHFSRPNRKFIIADVPGHEQYTRNMVTGASKADMALILVDARKGLLIQSKRHLFIAGLLATPHILIAVNKMDLVGYSQEIFEKIKKDFVLYASKIGIHDLQFIPISAAKGDMVVNRGWNMDWYKGSTLLGYLENVQISTDRNLIDFRFPVQCVVRHSVDGFRGYAGKIEGGIIKKGDAVIALPSHKKSKIKSILIGDRNADYAFNPQSAAISLEDELDISRGDMIVRENNLPIIDNSFEAIVNWFSDKPLETGKSYFIKHTAKMTKGFFENIKYKINVDNLHRLPADTLELNDIGRIFVKTSEPLFFDVYNKNKNTGSFIIIDELTNETAGVGLIISRGLNRELKLNRTGAGNKGAVLWFTGLSGSGKSTIADALCRKLLENNIACERLDGDVLRESLCKDLRFSREDRDENLNRVSFVANLLAKHGVVVLATFISPYRAKRDEIRKKTNNFVEIFVNAPLALCESRDPKGLYQKARQGLVGQFTGIHDPYEPPFNPEIELKTDELSVEECVEKIMGRIRKLLP